MSLSRARFAARLASLSSSMTAWCRDVLTPFEDRLAEPARREAVERFLKEIRQRLDDLEQEMNS